MVHCVGILKRPKIAFLPVAPLCCIVVLTSTTSKNKEWGSV